MNITRRNFLAAGTVTATVAAQTRRGATKVGIDLFSIRSSGWSPFEYLDYCAKWKADVVHFSEARFLGNLEAAHVRKVSEHARRLGIELEIGMSSICPTSARFSAKEGPAEEQLGRMIDAAKIAGSPIVRAYVGTAADRQAPGGIEKHIEATVGVLHRVKSRAVDANVKIAVENHAGDMQARELKMLIEAAGKDFVGACIDSGNPVWALEDPHLTLETLAPYGLTSHIRDSQVWRTPKGVVVRWVRTGEGNVGIDEWIRRYQHLCPGRTVTHEVLVTGPREFPVFDPAFWDGYRNVPAWEFSRFLALAERGKPSEDYQAPPKDQQAQREREDLEASVRHVWKVLGI